MIPAVNANSPNKEANGSEDTSWICEPEAHLRPLHVVVAPRELDYNPITQATRAKDLRENGANNESNVEKAMTILAFAMLCRSQE